MDLPEESLLLRVFLDEADRADHHPVYEALVTKARDAGLAGATVLRGVMGYGARRAMHTAKILDLSASLPIIVEIVDRPDKIEAFLPVLAGLMDGGMATLEKITVFHYQHPDRLA